MKKRVSIIQMEVQIGSVEENFKKAKILMDKAMEAKPDFIALPETFNSGFYPQEELEKYCDKNGEKVKEIFGSFAKKNSVNIVAGSVTNLKNDKIYNTSYIFNKKGELVGEYDKIHSFSPMGEHEKFSAGEKLAVFELDGIKCGVIICYDLRFCELIRLMALEGMDLLFVPAQWPLKRKEHWITLNRARAIENQMYVCAVNGCGKIDDKSSYGGNSLLINPWGEALLHLGKNEAIQSAIIDMEIVSKIRKSINVFRDRREDIYSFNKDNL